MNKIKRDGWERAALYKRMNIVLCQSTLTRQGILQIAIYVFVYVAYNACITSTNSNKNIYIETQFFLFLIG